MLLATLQLEGIRTALALLTAPRTSAPADFEIRFDVNIAIRAALKKRHVPGDQIKDTWKPSAAGFDVPAWGTTLVDFEELLQVGNPVYSRYNHQPAFASDTHAKALNKIEDYLFSKVKAAL